jgi:hypothetical protein
MVFRFLLRYLANNPKFIDKLSESYPMRRAAQLTVYLFQRSKSVLEEREIKQKAIRFKDKFSEELKKEWEKTRGGRP